MNSDDYLGNVINHLNIFEHIRVFSQIDIRNMMIKVDLAVVVSWLESRLEYKNLRLVQDINYVDVSLYR